MYQNPLISKYKYISLQRWGPRRRLLPRGHILKSLALASKPQVLENCPVLGSKTAIFFELLKFCRSPEKNFDDLFLEIAGKIVVKTFFLREHLPLVSLALASSIPVLGLEKVCPRKGCLWPRIFLCRWPWPRALCPRLHLC